MKKKKLSTFQWILISLIPDIIVIIFVLNWINPVWWQDFKLQTVPYWGFASVSNNPLLSGADADLQETDYQDKEIEPRINLDNLFSGGPPKDGIPSIDDPVFEPIDQTAFADDELIIGLEINGDARAYPYAILNWHELVNDTVGGTPVAVSYCPLCETNSVFIRELDGEEVEFGVSGKLYESCLVMYDRKTDTLYEQPWGVGIVGEKTNHVLERVPAIRTTIGQWREQHPDSQILTTDTGYNRNYDAYPYGSYYTNEDIIFPVSRQDLLIEHPKEITQIIFQHDDRNPTDRFSGEYHAYTQKQVRESTEPVEFTWDNRTGVALWDENLETIIFQDADGNVIPDMALFNFVYPAHFQ